MNTVQLTCLLALFALGGCASPSDSRGGQGYDMLPNALRHSPNLMTSGQPTARWFASDEAAQLQVIVHLWASKSAELSFNESQIVGYLRKIYVLQTIDFDRPNDEDLVVFLRMMNAFEGRSIQVHCQLNVLASSMVFLYEVIEEGREVYAAYEDVIRVWSPNSVWKNFFRNSLAQRGIDFDPN